MSSPPRSQRRDILVDPLRLGGDQLLRGVDVEVVERGEHAADHGLQGATGIGVSIRLLQVPELLEDAGLVVVVLTGRTVPLAA